MSVIVHIGDYAFQSLLISSIETFPSGYIGAKSGTGKALKKKAVSRHEGETFGLLFGQRMIKKDDYIFNVTLAVPMQATLHKQDGVSFSALHFQRIREVTESFPYLEFLGTFHSHPYPKDEYNGRPTSQFSSTDESTALEIAVDYGDDLLEVILGITALDRHSKRDAKSEGETIQSYCGRFKYSLSAYCTFGAASDDEDEDEDDDWEYEDEDTEEVEAELESEDDEWEDDDEDEETLEMGLMPVDRLICPLAAHGGGIFERAELSP